MDEIPADHPTTATIGTATPPPPPGPTPAGWGLLRSRRRWIGGVCEGLAVASGIDVVWIRLVAVAAAFSGIGVLTYLALWVLVAAEEPATGRVARPAPPDARRWLRIGVVAAAIVAVSNLFGGVWLLRGSDDDPGGFFVGLTLLAIGAVLLWRRRRPASAPLGPVPPVGTGEPGRAAATAPATTDATEPSATWPAPLAPTTPDAVVASTTDAVPTLSHDITAPAQSTAHASPWDAAAAAPTTTPWWARREDGGHAEPPRRRYLGLRVLTWLLVIGSAAVTAAVGAAVSVGALRMWAPGLWATLVVCSLVAVAIAATVAPMRVVAVSLIVLVAVGLSSLATLRFDGGAGERINAPRAAAEVPEVYRLGIGHLVVDLTSLPLVRTPDAAPTLGLPRTLRVEQGIGRLDVVLPDDVAVEVHTHLRAGQSTVFGRTQDGTDVRQHVVDPASSAGADSVSGDGLSLEVRLGLGQVVVCRASSARSTDAHRECTAP